MVFVGGLVTDLNRKEGQRNADEVERGVAASESTRVSLRAVQP